MTEELNGKPRLIVMAELEPVTGSAFQPTGFPDLGAAEFERPLGDTAAQQSLLVESVQSMANHLEGIGWDMNEDRPVEVLSGLPYVEVRDTDGRFLTSSRLEPHRLAGAYIKTATVEGKKAGEWMIERLGVEKGKPLDWRSIYEAIFRLDPLCLLHGVFFSDPQWKDYGNPKIRRALTAVIEAHDVRPVVYGGVKRDDVNPTVGEGRGAKEGFGFVPFGRTEYTAREIQLIVTMDVEQIRGYGLPPAETALLEAIGLWEIRSLLDRPLRLRTACDLEVRSLQVRQPEGFDLPSAEALAEQIARTDLRVDEGIPHKAIFK
ncbi:MAG TPA: type I-U CRISPR-associated RAMP protein Csb1/Cas7u [Solirubrobacteraceae bacterium]|nr:type I-U CRISPR-associated RAMP protein Csb1/Cas7u [Solirubrobacteraceae bacterium]